jgi:hypothetical protein
LPPPDLLALMGEVRDLTRRYMAGTHESFTAFRDLADLLLRLTVLAPRGVVRLAQGRRPDTLVLGGWRGPDDPLPLRDNRYLRLSITLFLAQTPEGHRLKVLDSSYQYQADRDGGQWVFRYDYLRTPPYPHPAAHLQIRGGLAGGVLSAGTSIERFHFPTGRVSLEAVIRLLADQFQVPCSEPPEIWRPVLAESEQAFLAIARRPLSGPAEYANPSGPYRDGSTRRPIRRASGGASGPRTARAAACWRPLVRARSPALGWPAGAAQSAGPRRRRRTAMR